MLDFARRQTFIALSAFPDIAAAIFSRLVRES